MYAFQFSVCLKFSENDMFLGKIGWKIARMAQEDQIHYGAGDDGSLGFGISSNSSKSSYRKSKQRKAPQRGLGVAQLEKIRLEEQQQKNAAAILSPTSLSSGKTSLNPSVLVSNSNPAKQSSNSIPFTSLSPANFMFRSPFPSHNIDGTNSSNVSLVQANNGGFGTGWSEVSVLAQVSKPWNPQESNLNKDNSVFDSSLGFRSNFCLTDESNYNWPCTGLVQKKQQYQPSSSAGMDVSSSSLLNFLTEPPSNQSYYGNYTTIWPEEERMAGMKRPYPFSLENPPGPSFNFRLPRAAPMRSDESASCGNISLYSYPVLGEGPSCSSSSSEPNSRKKMKENAFNGDLLTLAPPASTWMCQSSKFKHPSAHVLYSNHEYPDLGSLHFQGDVEVRTFTYPELSKSSQHQPFYRFLPPAMAQSGQAFPKTVGRSNDEVDESVDLNLKL